MTDQGEDVQPNYARPRTPRVVVVLELASLALLGWYLYVLLVPDTTQRGLRAWSLASQACYGGAAALGQAGMACERRYLALTAG